MPKDHPLNVTIVGHQFWWEYRYTDADTKFTTANELHIPTGRSIRIVENGTLGNADVIHSWWVPKLSGKTDNIPGRVNKLTLETDKPGTYLGQCAEFCGLSHANMRLRVIAERPADFARWVAAQQQPEPPKPDEASPAGQGRLLFEAKGCSGCHTVTGLSRGNSRPRIRIADWPVRPCVARYIDRWPAPRPRRPAKTDRTAPSRARRPSPPAPRMRGWRSAVTRSAPARL